MSDSGDEADSRTAAVGNQRARSANSSGRSSRDSSRPTKRQRRNLRDDVTDLVPRGASFSATPLEVDPSDTDSSGSNDEPGSEQEKPDASEKQVVNPHKGSTVPAISWNQGKKSAIRTTLGKRKAPAAQAAVPVTSKPELKLEPKPEPKSEPEPEPKPEPTTQSTSKPTTETNANTNTKTKPKTNANEKATQFSAVNHYWKSRDQSASPEPSIKDASNEDSGDATSSEGDSDSGLEEGEIDSDGDLESISQDSEADDSILLNIGSKGMDGASDERLDDSVMANGRVDSPIQSAPVLQNGTGAGSGSGRDWPQSKEEAFQLFSRTYPTPPETLMDLNQKDMDIQVKFFYITREIIGQGMDLQLPIGCIMCYQTGHLDLVCSTNECTHCNAWGSHSSNDCPKWRRCQKCRERGHHEKQCPSALKSSASEVPCDHCGSSNHTEIHCLYKTDIPQRPADPKQEVKISVCCAHCLSRSHLIADCPSLPVPMENPFFSLKGIPPDNIVDLNKMEPTDLPIINYVLPPEPPRFSRNGPPSNARGRGRPGAKGGINARSPSPPSDDMFPRRGRGRPQPVRGPARGGHIRFGDNVGFTRGSGPDKSRGKSPAPRGRTPDSAPARGRPAPNGSRGRGSSAPPRGGASRGGAPRGGAPRGGAPRGGAPRGGAPRGGASRGAPRGGGGGRGGRGRKN